MQNVFAWVCFICKIKKDHACDSNKYECVFVIYETKCLHVLGDANKIYSKSVDAHYSKFSFDFDYKQMWF
jgi:hypothetical protein